MIFIGWDPRDALAAEVCVSSIRRRSDRVAQFLKLDDPDVADAYGREWYVRGGQRYDTLDCKPFSSDFSFSRFLVPHLTNFTGWALFTDPDTLWLESPDDLFALADEKYAVMVVKHDHVPENASKMGGLAQTTYPRKNWSSVCLWNCAHPSNRILSPALVNTATGKYLHGFEWLQDHEIGALDGKWNHLVGVQTAEDVIAVIHWTDGAPTFKEYADARYSGFFWTEARDYWWQDRLE